METTYVKILAALVVLVVAFLIYRIRTRKPTLVATISVRPNGQRSVVFNPETSDKVALVRLMLLYSAKIRWLLIEEPADFKDLLQSLSFQALDVWSSVSVPDLLTGMPSLELLERGRLSARDATEGEVYVCRLFQVPGGGYVTNDLPGPGLAVNLVWHLLPLWQGVRSRLDMQSDYWAHRAFQSWYDIVFSELGDDNSIPGWSRMSDEINAAIAKAQTRSSAASAS